MGNALLVLAATVVGGLLAMATQYFVLRLQTRQNEENYSRNYLKDLSGNARRDIMNELRLANKIELYARLGVSYPQKELVDSLSNAGMVSPRIVETEEWLEKARKESQLDKSDQIRTLRDMLVEHNNYVVNMAKVSMSNEASRHAQIRKIMKLVLPLQAQIIERMDIYQWGAATNSVA